MGMTIAIKDFELPPSCYNCNFCMRRRTSDYGYFGMCDLTNEEGINLYEHSRSEDCPLVEAIPKANVYKAIQEMMKYEHEGFINISLARLDEILKKCGVQE